MKPRKLEKTFRVRTEDGEGTATMIEGENCSYSSFPRYGIILDKPKFNFLPYYSHLKIEKIKDFQRTE